MESKNKKLNDELTLDPEDWDKMRALGHQMIDDMMDYLQNIKQSPVWKKMPDEAKQFLKQDIPKLPQSSESIYKEFKQHIFPYNKGNIHPRFWAWVEGTGTPLGALSEMLAAMMNPVVGIGEHSAMYVDEQVLAWCKTIIGFKESASGILVSGASIANLTALIVARNHYLGKNARKAGLKAVSGQLVLYCSSETHSCIQKAAEAIGLGSDAVKKISVNEHYQMNIEELKNTIREDLEKDLIPFCVVGNVGTVNTGAIDPLDEIIAVCRQFNLWFHIDGAFGALTKLVPEYSERLKGIEVADSIAFDLHKWMYMPYEIGCVLIKNAEAHKNAFAVSPNYLLNHERGVASGPESYSNFGLELSRGFKSLKAWMSFKEHGIEKYAYLIKQNIEQAHYLSDLIKQSPYLELITPVSMNIVCFRYSIEEASKQQLDILNKEIVMQLQEQQIATASSTFLKGQYTIRAAITNHRSKRSDFETLVKEVVRIGNELKSAIQIANAKEEKN